MSLFASTAEYYRHYRSGIPADVAAVLNDAAPAGRPRRLLDVGTGTGLVIDALLPQFDEVVGVDRDAELLAVADAEFTGAPVRLMNAPAEAFSLEPGWQAHMVTVCRAFHWFDREAFLARIPSMMVADGTLAVFGDQSIWAGGDEWKDRARAVVQEVLGEHRRAGDGTYARPARTYTEDLADAGFTGIDERLVPVVRTRTLDSVIGLLHSMSFASPAVLGDSVERFDRRIAEELTPLVDAEGLLTDHNEFHIVTGRRPSS